MTHCLKSSRVEGLPKQQEEYLKMSEVIDNKALRILTFYLKHSDWLIWKAKFLAKENQRGYRRLPLEIWEVPEESQEIDEMNIERFDVESECRIQWLLELCVTIFKGEEISDYSSNTHHLRFEESIWIINECITKL